MSSIVLSPETGVITEPPYYHREYKNDVPKECGNSLDNSWVNTAQRVAFTALPFISLYKPLSFPLSLAMGGLRTFTCVSQLLQSIKNGNTQEIPYAMLQTTIAVISLAGTIFAHPLGMLISTGHDLLIETVHLIENLRKGEYQKAMENCFGIINNALYLALFLHGGLEIAIASLALQILLGLYHSQEEFRKGHYIEAAGHLLMAIVRGNQLSGQVKILNFKYNLNKLVSETRENIVKTITKNTPDLKIDKRSVNFKKFNSNINRTVNQAIKIKAVSANSDKELIDVLLKYPHDTFRSAIQKGDIGSVTVLINNGYGFEDRSNLLSCSIWHRKNEIAKLLIDRGFASRLSELPPNYSYPHPLITALSHQNIDVTEWLLKAGADPNVKITWNFTFRVYDENLKSLYGIEGKFSPLQCVLTAYQEPYVNDSFKRQVVELLLRYGARA